MEVEILVAEIGVDRAGDQLFHLLYDGTIVDEEGSTVLGGDADTIAGRLTPPDDGVTVTAALRDAVAALAGPERTLGADDLEVAVLDRTQERRAFRRIVGDELPPQPPNW